MDLAWDDVQLFLAIAESGGLSAAARQLRLGQPTVSRRLAELERRLGYPLFQRTPTGAQLTSAGERLLVPARRMAEWAGEVTRTAAHAERTPEGTVRVTAPPGVAFEFLAPFAAQLRAQHPRLRLEVLSSMHYLDLARGEADLALRMRAPTDGDLMVVAHLEHDNAVFVSEAYAAKLPKKPSPADLDWVGWAPPYQALPPNPQLEAMIPGWRPTFTADSFLILLRAAQEGVGAIVLDRARHRFADRRGLVALPIELGPHARSHTHLVCARSALDIPRVRMVADLLARELAYAAAHAPGRAEARARGRAEGRARGRAGARARGR